MCFCLICLKICGIVCSVKQTVSIVHTCIPVDVLETIYCIAPRHVLKPSEFPSQFVVMTFKNQARPGLLGRRPSTQNNLLRTLIPPPVPHPADQGGGGFFGMVITQLQTPSLKPITKPRTAPIRYPKPKPKSKPRPVRPPRPPTPPVGGE